MNSRTGSEIEGEKSDGDETHESADSVTHLFCKCEAKYEVCECSSTYNTFNNTFCECFSPRLGI